MRRSQGRSSVAAAAYRLGEKIKDERIGKMFNYSKKGGILDKFFILPNGAKKFQNTSHFWNEAERSENRKNSVVAREIIINLPYEISDQQRSELVKKFCNEIVANHSVGITAASTNLVKMVTIEISTPIFYLQLVKLQPKVLAKKHENLMIKSKV